MSEPNIDCQRCRECSFPIPQGTGHDGLCESCFEDELITVCQFCHTASCWQGEFYCQKYRTAGIIQKTRRELREIQREHPSYWKTDGELALE